MSVDADYIAALRRLIASNKGKIKRAVPTRSILLRKIHDCSEEIRLAKEEIRRLGGRLGD
jgi:hypothetical protein